jgi:transglutaminase-like putative cysteine protease
MKPSPPVDIARYSGRLWWLMLAAAAARFTAMRPASDAIDGFLFWLIVLALCAVLRIAARRGPHAGARAQRVGNAVALVGVGVALIRLESTLLPALLSLLMTVQAGLFIASEKRTHVWLILAASFAVLLFAAAQAHSPWFLPCAAAFTFMALSLLALDHRNQREQAAMLQPMEPFVRHSGGLLFTALALLLTLPAYLFVPKPGGWLLGSIETTSANEALPSAMPHQRPALPPLPPLPPEEQQAIENVPPTSTLSPESSNPVAHPESGDYGNDFGIGDVERRKVNGNSIVLYARSSHPVNLRGKIYDRFDGYRWSRTPTIARPFTLDDGDALLPFVAAGPTRVNQSVELEANLEPTLVHAPGILRLRFPAASVQLFDDGVVVSNVPLRANTIYSVDSRLALNKGRYLLRERLPDDELTSYLQADTASPRLRELAERITADSTDTLAKAIALEQHLRTNYEYTYETIEQQNYTPLDHFLFETRRGHCEFFASALAMMLRSVGIPARVATGFALGDPNPITGFHEVRALDGHAWVEAYLEGEGWLMMEPTPFYPLPQPGVDRRIAEQMDGYLDRLAQTRELLEPDTLGTQLTLLTRDTWRAIRFALRQLSNLVRAMGWLLPLGVVAAAMSLLALSALGIAVADWFDNLRIRRILDSLHRADDRAATLLLATSMERTLAPRALGRRDDWTLREYARVLASVPYRSTSASVIPEDFLEAFDAARYGSILDESARGSLTTVADLMRQRLQEDPWPRLRGFIARLRVELRRMSRHRVRRVL